MPSDDTIQRLFEKLDTLKDVVNEVKIDVATIKEKQSKHYELNDREHQNMVSLIADTKTEVDAVKEEITDLKEGHDEQQSALDEREGERKGERRILARGWELLIALIAGGALLAIGKWLIDRLSG